MAIRSYHSITRFLPMISLVGVALLCGLIWRWELYNHGWEGLGWLSYFQMAMPAGFGLFLIWSNLFVRLPWHQRLLINGIAVLYGCVAWILLVQCLVHQLIMGPRAMMMFAVPAWQKFLFQHLPLVLIPLMPAGVYFLLRIFGKQVDIWWLIAAMVCMVISRPVAEIMLEVVDHRGGSDYIHAFKSGFIIPCWVFSIGLVIVGHAKAVRKAHETVGKLDA